MRGPSLSAAVLIVVTALLSLPAVGVAAQSLSEVEEKAVRKAREFCALVGSPVDDAAEVRIVPSEARPPDEIGTIAVELARLSLHSVVRVSVDPQTGAIVSFADPQPMPGPDALLDRERALSLAQHYLDAAGGLPGPAVFRYATLDRIHPDSPTWSLRWDRRIGEYECPGDGASVIIAADTGRLIALGIGWRLPPPKSLVPALSREQAAELARVYVRTEAPVRETKLMIVRGPWRSLTGEPLGGERNLILAWLVALDDPSATSVLLDSASGALVDIGRRMCGDVASRQEAGQSAALGGSSRVREILRTATAVELLDRANPGRGGVLVSLTKSDNPGALTSLPSLVGPDCEFGLKREARYQLRVMTNKGETIAFDYFPPVRIVAARTAEGTICARAHPDFDRLLRGDAGLTACSGK